MQGNGNHGWAPIEEWAAGLRAELDSPHWADTVSSLTATLSLTVEFPSRAAPG